MLSAAGALSLVPLTAPGVPVLAAGGVAVLVGVLAKGQDPTEIPGIDEKTFREQADIAQEESGQHTVVLVHKTLWSARRS